MGKTGQTETGESLAGEPIPTAITLPAQTVSISTPNPGVAGSGQVSFTVPETSVTITTQDPPFSYVIIPTATTLSVETQSPGVTGVGTVTATAPVTTASITTPEQFIGFIYWAIDGTPVSEHVSETRDWQTLGLVFRADSTTLSNELKPLKDTADKYEIVPASDGSFSTLDRAATDGVYKLTPPVGRRPPREERDYLVEQYTHRQLGQDGESHEVDVSFVAKSNREPDGTAMDETRSSDEWSFAFRSATVATSRVTPDVNEGTNTAAETVDLTLLLDDVQTKILEESLTRLAAVSVREVPDGTNTVDDDSDGPADANTFAVTTPDGESPIPDGNYVAMDWSSERRSDRLFRVDLTIGKP